MMSTSPNQDEQFKDENIIIGKIVVDEKDVVEKKEIRIINSYENFHKDRNIERNGYSFTYDNEREIRRVIKIIIDENPIKFSYYHIFNKKGSHRLQYCFNEEFQWINHMFADCIKLTRLDFTHFHFQVRDMRSAFSGCESLQKIVLSNLNTERVKDMSRLFCRCLSLEELNLSKLERNGLLICAQCLKIVKN